MVMLLGLVEYPVFATMLLLTAGILVGYAICYPFRADTTGVSEQLEQVQQQNESLRSALDEQRDAYARLEQKHGEQQFEWAQVRDSQLDLTTAWNQFGQNYSEVTTELKQLKAMSDDANELLAHERAERRVAEEALLAAEDKIAKLERKIDQADDRETQSSALQIRLDEAHAQIARLNEQIPNAIATGSEELSRTVKELEERRVECRQLKEALDSQGRELQIARDEVEKSRDSKVERANLVGAIGVRRNQIVQLESERDEARANEHRIRRELEKFKSSTLQRDRDLDRLRNLENRFMAESEEVGTLRQRVSELETVTAQRDELQVAVERITNERDAATAAQRVASATMSKVEKHAKKNRELSKRCADAVSKLQLEQESRQMLETRLDDAQDELATLRQRCLSLQHADEECAKLRSALDDDRKRLQQATIERDAAFAAESAAKDALNRLEERASDPLEVDRIRQQREEILSELETVRRDRERLQRAVRRQEEQITSLQALTCRLEASSATGNTLSERLAEQSEKLRKISLEHELNAASLGQAEQTIKELRQLLSARQATIETLQRERELVERRSRNAAALGQPPKTTSETRRDPRLGMVFVRPPANRDDLKRISGVEETLEARLNDFGVFTFEQIMNWDDLAIAEFSKLLSFRDRIQRENWIGQARRLQSGLQERAA